MENIQGVFILNTYLGHLGRNDCLYHYLEYEIFPQLGGGTGDGIRVFGTNGSNAVYIYEERGSNLRAVGKFFCSRQMNDPDRASHRLEREWDNLNRTRALLGGCHYVARPLGKNRNINCLLVTEYCNGIPLENIINRAIYCNDTALLHEKLAALAWFLAELHNRSALQQRVDFNLECGYFEHLTDMLSGEILSAHDRRILKYGKDLWRSQAEMHQDNAVLVHGDATPANFFFGDGSYVISFDLERMKYSDRIFDVGRIAGELQHFFLRATGNKYLAETFISGFLHEYASHFPDRDRAFDSIVSRVPFYMGMTLLRIARNTYLAPDYRRRLIAEAQLCLKRN